MVGLRELAGRTEASAATLSRVIDLLERDGIVERDERGAVLTVDWATAIRRWAQDYDVLRSNDAVGYLHPRGLPAFAGRLTETDLDYALNLRETEAGANVMILRPFDDIVSARTLEREGLRLVNPSQLAVDLLTGPGSAPAEGEELLAWTTENPDAWRS